jgi:transposase
MIVHDLIDRIRVVKRRLLELRELIGKRLAERNKHLLEVFGCGPLLAGAIVGQVNDIRHFATKSRFAAGNGTAPIPASSGITNRHRLNRRGDRQLNRAITQIALTQIRCHPPAQAYFAKKLAEGKTKKDALRSLKRRISDAVYRALRADAALDIT